MSINIVKKVLFLLLFRGVKGQSIFDERWDNLIILDACRYDVFYEVLKEYGYHGDNLEYKISLGSDTTEFLLRNFTKERYDDIVYVTANPFVSIILKGKVHRIIPVWDLGWDQELGTVPPEAVVYYALKAYSQYPGKRLIVHFIQPHYPYVSHAYEPMRRALNELRLEAKRESSCKDFSLPLRFRRILRVLCERKIYHARFYIEIDEEIHKRAYKDNLRYALPYAIRLAKLLPGKNVITADHGEAFGEKLHPLIPIKVYGHLPEIHIPVLVRVPWFVIENSISREQVLPIILKEIIRLRILIHFKSHRVLS